MEAAGWTGDLEQAGGLKKVLGMITEVLTANGQGDTQPQGSGQTAAVSDRGRVHEDQEPEQALHL